MEKNCSKMDAFTIKRWSALIDGVNLIYDKAESHGLDIKNVTIKQNSLVKFVDEVSETIRLS